MTADADALRRTGHLLDGAAGGPGDVVGQRGMARFAGPERGMVAAFILAIAALLPLSPAHANPVKTPHVTAELVAQRTAVQPGEPVAIGLRLQHIAHWHTYWRNPGDSGLPTSVNWTLPAGSSMGDIAWPAPQRLPIGPLVNYGYEGDLLLPMTFTPPADAAPGSTLTLRAKADWLVCNDVCIPETATLELRLPVMDAQTAPGTSLHAPLFARTEAEQPVPWKGGVASVQQAGTELLLTLQFDDQPTAPSRGPGLGLRAAQAVHVFPYAEQTLEPARHELFRTPQGYAVKLALMDGAKLPATLQGVLVAQGDPLAGALPPWGGPHRAVEFSAPVRAVAALELPAGAVAIGADAAAPSPLTPLAAPSGTASVGVLAAVALAFVGGLLLNLMPCVFPVLSIKLLSLAQQGSDRATLRAHAGAYAVGVVLSFLLLAAVLLALRAAGNSVGWGFQLQEPGVVFLLALLFFALGLNLMGAFELRQFLPQRLGLWRSRRPSVDAFGSGVLAVVAASPCTAPFMGAALGFAIGQSAAVALAVFAALGLGMALPYVLLVLLPGWRARLPRPGAWMLHLKQGLAFPMFATVVWLVWVLGQQAGIDAAARVLLALVGMGVLVWLIGLPSGPAGSSGRPRRAGQAAKALGSVAMVALMAWSWPGPLQAGAAADASGTTAADPAATPWQPYDETALARHLAQGRPVFVDFTAAWCVTCQVNKRLVLNADATMGAFRQANVALMRADWTSRDETITKALARLGRNGVPVYALIAPGRAPVLLPEILTLRIVRDALATLPAATSVSSGHANRS